MSSAHSADDTEIYRRIKTGDIAARNYMVEKHSGLIKSVVSYYAIRNRHIDIDDLLQEGQIGLIAALRRYDVDSGYRFSTYATYWIRQVVQRYVVANHSMGTSARRKETEAYLGERMSPEEARLYEERCVSYIGLSGTSDAAWDVLERSSSTDHDEVHNSAIESIEWQIIRKLLFHESISSRQRTIISMRYGIMGNNHHTILEISEMLGIPRHTVAKEERVAMETLRKLAEDSCIQ